MSRVKVLVDNQLDSELVTAGKRLVVVDFTATWCGPCKMISPYFEQLSSEYKDVIFLKVDVDQCKSTTQSQGVRAMPTFKFFIERKQVHEFSGADKNQLKSSIERLQPQLSFASQGNALGGGGGGSGNSRQAYLDNLEKKQQEQQAQYQQQYGNTTTSPTVPTPITSSSSSTATKSRPPARATQPDPIMMKDLIDMGFPENRCRKALIMVNNSSSQSAMDWIFENMDSPTIDDPLEGDTGATTTKSESTTTTTPSTTNTDGSTTTTTTTTTTTSEQKEYPTTVHNALCDMCQNQIIGYRYKCKVCPNYDLCQTCKDTNKHNPEHEFVAHENDIENYQMTPEEKAEQKKRLEARIQEIRVKKAEEEAKKEIEREINRRQGGKSTQQALTKWQEDQLKREQEKDRKEKEADRIAKAKIKAKVEADRLERAAKKNATLNNNVATTTTTTTTTPTPVPVYVPKQNYTESLIQIRLTDGTTIKGTFPLSTKLIDVHTFISNNTSQHGKFTLSSTYPRKIYTNDELKSISVQDAGLVPNGTLQVQKL
ncbi:ZZ-type zinc finger-containing protein [Dictyostelium discoideum AX4]|uniref:ZZ-type zinc finger-containing protein n=1 Tax=Dictyostelium discoideum TaxID=44689 RepID=Q75JM6_DICDI|nr:ZZ-type zinc finger-containing protein [Dictyostelium discoideum AX4]EAL69328.1 ZZ-type zinc finger-containing protein [Dictyostelium discoideum AX4]|eukprot:XP_643331.1 ZZ-type zinc finger-containing protein [Dictyostelium discoideum AX4]